ncbi:hypothetical protein CRG98_013926 [Punica granatum]|uniref:Uncharacterized protein n=1 Tax=Punica granatum TaxID=22663 RepID=A0A2I0KAT2_PUNGR|nr:hypothetical protein CRG98_013926 [Punica granatum]
MSMWVAVSCQVAASARLSTLKPASSGSQAAALLVPRRGLAGSGDHHGPPKVTFWEDPMNPSKWKEEHFVIVSLAGWGLVLYGGFKFFTKGNDNNKKEQAI